MRRAPELKGRRVRAKILQPFPARYHHRLYALRSVPDAATSH